MGEASEGGTTQQLVSTLLIVISVYSTLWSAAVVGTMITELLSMDQWLRLAIQINFGTLQYFPTTLVSQRPKTCICLFELRVLQAYWCRCTTAVMDSSTITGLLYIARPFADFY